MSPRGRLLWPESYVLKLTHKHLTGKKKVRYTNTGMLENSPLSNIIETSEDCIHVHQRHHEACPDYWQRRREEKQKEKKPKHSTLQNWDANSHIYPLKGFKNAWLDDILFFLKQAGERKNLPIYTGKSRIQSVRFDRIHRVKVRIESRRCIESFTLWLIRVVDTATTHRQPKGRRRWKNSTDRQIKRQKNAVSYFFPSLPLDCLSMHVCPQIQHALQTNRSVKERKLTYLWSLWAYGTSDFCHYYDRNQIRSATQQQGQIEEGAERRRAFTPTATRSPRTPALPKAKSTASTRDSGAILKCQHFFLQVSFQMPTRLYT